MPAGEGGRLAQGYKGHLAGNLDAEDAQHRTIDPKRFCGKVQQSGNGGEDACEYPGEKHKGGDLKHQCSEERDQGGDQPIVQRCKEV